MFPVDVYLLYVNTYLDVGQVPEVKAPEGFSLFIDLLIIIITKVQYVHRLQQGLYVLYDSTIDPPPRVGIFFFWKKKIWYCINNADNLFVCTS